jgi:hypothetical protein
VTAVTATQITALLSSFNGASTTVASGTFVYRLPRFKMETAAIITGDFAPSNPCPSFALISVISNARIPFTATSTNTFSVGARQRISLAATATSPGTIAVTSSTTQSVAMNVAAVQSSAAATYQLSTNGMGDGVTNFNVANLTNATIPAGTFPYIRVS